MSQALYLLVHVLALVHWRVGQDAEVALVQPQVSTGGAWVVSSELPPQTKS